MNPVYTPLPIHIPTLSSHLRPDFQTGLFSSSGYFIFSCLGRSNESVQVRGPMNISQHDAFCREQLSEPRTTIKLKDHSFSAVHYYLFDIFAATLHLWVRLHPPYPKDAPCHADRHSLNVASCSAKQI